MFARTLGETSDVVTKEMYTFADRSGESHHAASRGHRRGGARLHLRRPGPGAAAQAVLPRPMFRHERPQKGRFRQFHQVGIELLGVERSPRPTSR